MKKCCESLKESLLDFLEGELAPELCASLEQHLRECPECEVVVSTTRRTIRLYREGSLYVELPLEVRQRLTLRLRSTLRPD
ncbi:zf-HC2 domain-containing protein [bacterium CPR1]|nr:zf-HC2 domain-containing protein [bacterium CPR1]